MTIRAAAGFLILATAVGLLPLIVGKFLLSVMVVAGFSVIAATGLGLLVGQAGQVSLAQGAFYGLGAYGSAILSSKAGLNPWLSLALAALITGVVAYAIGRPTLKLKGHYLSLATLGFGIIVYIALGEAGDLTGGPSGLGSIPRLAVGGFRIGSDLRYYYLTWAVALLAILIARTLVATPWGRALKAVSASETAAEAMGVDTARRKLEAFVLSAVYASVAGSLYAHYMTFINPDQFSFMSSVQFLLMASVGGLASLYGPLVGVLTVTGLVELLREVLPKLLPSLGSEIEIILFGLLLVLIMILAPAGLAGMAGRLGRRLRKEAASCE